MIIGTGAEVFPPGDFLKEELEARGWTQVELGEILGRPPRLINEIIAGKRSITPETAKGLAAAFGTSAELWMNLETSYQLAKARIEEVEVARRAKLYGKFPVKEMIKRGWIEDSSNLDVLEQQFIEFFDMDSMDAEPKFAHAAKKTSYAEMSILQLAWLARARQIARGVLVQAFSNSAFDTLIAELRNRLQHADSVRDVPPLLANAGIRLVVVEALPGTKMDAACFWIDARSPVIALSLLRDRIDNFWHTLFHELDHVAHGEGKDTPIIDDGVDETVEVDQNQPQKEKRANQNAANYCVPAKELEGWVARVRPLFSREKILGFALRMNVHPGIVVGQLQKRGLIPWSHHRNLLEKYRHHLIRATLTDGFGHKIAL